MSEVDSNEIAREGVEGCWNCAEQPTENLKRMFVDVVQDDRIRQGQLPAKRPVFLKPHGIANGRFEMREDLPDDLRVGVFGLKTIEAWVRFSSDALPGRADLKTTCGIGIKLFGVSGPKLIEEGRTQDFLLQNHDVFFVDTAQDMCEFTKAGVINGDYGPYLEAHPDTKRILDEMQKVETSVLTATYWSVVPYAFGAERYVKYRLEPELASHVQPPINAINYLADDLARRLLEGEARFRFMVQFRTDPSSMPLDAATVRWSEQESPPVHVATLILPKQDIRVPEQAAYGENLSFNPWHSLKDHEPQGSISEARKAVYAASARRRHNANGIPSGEPQEPQPSSNTTSSDSVDNCVVKAAIYPAVGVARVGNSQHDFFYGPEVTEPNAPAPGYYRDATGALKRQAARFRIYGLNAEGKAVRELTSHNAKIDWSVHLANKKAAWYQFQLALDIPEAASAAPSLLRNAGINDRSQLTIDPGPRQIEGFNKGNDEQYVFDSGEFVGKRVYLGELKTDDAGRLIVLGGRGLSASWDGSRAVTFANNEGWHDDISDGPVTAKVTYGDRELTVDPAWVIVAPPNYAPMQKSVRTMWDLMRHVAIDAGMLVKPIRPSFETDIRPIFERLSNLQWVNAGFAAAFGWSSPNDFSKSDWMDRLADRAPENKELRRTIANHFRSFERDSWSPTPWPWVYGDAMNIPPAATPRQHTALTDTQLSFLGQWVEGDFVSDYDPARQRPSSIDHVPIEDQPAMLDRASMEYCLADAFHPGCEMTWPVRNKMMYMGPFRFKHASVDWKEPGYGAGLTQDVLSLPDGPLGGQVPGGVTRWMAIPWQTDTASCRSGYAPKYDPYLPTFWPARVPNQVLSRENYDIVVDATKTLGERLAAFANRASWLRSLGNQSYTDQINNMIKDFGKLGVVERQPALAQSPHFPGFMQVEQLAPQAGSGTTLGTTPGSMAPPPGHAEHVDLSRIEKVRRFPHGLRY